MDAWRVVSATIDPTELLAQTGEGPIDIVNPQALTPIFTVRTDEE